MKVNLATHERQFIDGYDNYVLGPEVFTKIPDAICTEILMIDSLDYAPPDTLLNTVKKLRHGGVIQIVGTDLLEISRAIFLGLLPMEECNVHLTNSRIKIVPLIQVQQQLQQMGLEVIESALKSIKYDIRAKRP